MDIESRLSLSLSWMKRHPSIRTGISLPKVSSSKVHEFNEMMMWYQRSGLYRIHHIIVGNTLQLSPPLSQSTDSGLSTVIHLGETLFFPRRVWWTLVFTIGGLGSYTTLYARASYLNCSGDTWMDWPSTILRRHQSSWTLCDADSPVDHSPCLPERRMLRRHRRYGGFSISTLMLPNNDTGE